MPVVASVGARYAEPGSWLRERYRKYTPWNLAEVARVSLAYGNEHRSDATARDVLECCAAYSSLSDPDFLGSPNLDTFAKFMLRMSHEQMPHQLSMYNELARSIAMFEHTEASKPLTVLVDGWDQDLLGCTVTEYVVVASLLYFVGQLSGGIFLFDFLDQQEFRDGLGGLSKSTVCRIAARHFIAEAASFRESVSPVIAKQPPSLRRYNFNPLHDHPVIGGLVDQYVLPVPSLVIRKASPLGFYYAGVARRGNGFAEDVGTLFEAYVGRLLKLMSDATTYPEITYARDKRRSVDWIAVFDDVTLLVEAKSTRSTEAIRAASDTAGHDLRKRLGHAVEQIETTARLISDRQPEFREIPQDRPIIGLVITMEPFHVINAPMYRTLLPDCSVPYRVCSVHDLEALVALEGQSVGTFLLEFVNDPARHDWDVSSAVSGRPLGRNDVLAPAWEALPWRSRQTSPVAEE